MLIRKSAWVVKSKSLSKLFHAAFVAIFIVSCDGSGEEENTFDSDTTVISDEYPALDYTVVDVMEQLQMCSNDPIDTTKTDSLPPLPPCSSDYFRAFRHQPTKDWKYGFIVEMVPGMYGIPVHQLVVIENIFGKYKIVNQYWGHLIEMRTTPSGYNQLLIGYTDPEMGVVEITHEWQGNKYDLKDVEAVDGVLIGPDVQDSINAMFLPAFNAGY